ncbi:MAG: hypothetical protein H0V14_11095 [Chitinophagaceae bacterium]|nr:hypothetical protein [Chitinophagaceae bacterium]
MPNRPANALFQLIKSLKKSEKRNFKLYVTRNSSMEDLKIIQLFDALDKMEEYDEELLLKKNETIKKLQLSNLNASLYKQILSSLRLIKDEGNIDLQLHEQMDYARILFNKGLFIQSLQVLDKTKKFAHAHNQVTYLMQALFFEKKIESLYITRSIQDRADQLIAEANVVTGRLATITHLSNLSLKLYGWYIKHGHARTEQDDKEVEQLFNESLPAGAMQSNSFYEKLYLYQSYCWYAFIRQDFLSYYRYTQKWVDLFEKEPTMIEVETTLYIKAMHNLMGAHFDLQNYEKLTETLLHFEKFSHSNLVIKNENNLIQTFVYLNTSRLNKHFLEGTFTEGLKLVPEIEQKLTEYELYLDRHRVLIFYYKIASLYFGSGDSSKAIDYLNKIINWKVDLRTDLQCYSRLLHLIAHYELGNFDLMEYLIKSVYRFMSKMENLSIVEEEMFAFLRRSFYLSAKDIKPELQKLLLKLKKHEHNRFETRAFLYLDVVSWLESKIENIPVQEVIQKKFKERRKRTGKL